MAVGSFSSVQIFVFIALSYSRASGHKACEATCKVLFLYCGVKKPQVEYWHTGQTHWHTALQGRPSVRHLHLLNPCGTWLERLSWTLLDPWRWTSWIETLREKREVKADTFWAWSVFGTCDFLQSFDCIHTEFQPTRLPRDRKSVV